MIPAIAQETLETQLSEMKGNEFIYRGAVIEILEYMIGTGDEGNDVEIYLNNGQTIYANYLDVKKHIANFTPITEQARALQKKQDMQLSVCAGSVVTELRTTLIEQIRILRENPSKEVLAQSKMINDTINQFTNLARTELEYKRFLNGRK